MKKTVRIATESIIRNFNRWAKDYEKNAWLLAEMREQLLQRLQYMNFNPETILDLGCGPHGAYNLLQQNYPAATIFGIDISEVMLQQAQSSAKALVCANAHYLPLAPNSMDLIIANGLLPWCELTSLFNECFRILSPEGIFLFSSFGPDTLKELKQIFQTIDTFPHTHAFVDMHDVGDCLLASGFADPVMDMELIAVTYEDVQLLFHDLRTAGMGNLHPERRRSLMTASMLQHMQQHYDTLRLENNELPATFEVIYGHGWVPSVKHLRQGNDVYIPIEQLKTT